MQGDIFLEPSSWTFLEAFSCEFLSGPWERSCAEGPQGDCPGLYCFSLLQNPKIQLNHLFICEFSFNSKHQPGTMLRALQSHWERHWTV